MRGSEQVFSLAGSVEVCSVGVFHLPVPGPGRVDAVHSRRGARRDEPLVGAGTQPPGG